MFGYYKTISGFEMLIKVFPDYINITVPSYDVYDETVLFYEINDKNFSFQYDKYLFKYCCPEFFLKENVRTREKNKINLAKIGETEYYLKSQKKDRRELLKEKYDNGYELILHRYCFEDEMYYKLREITQMSKWLDEKDEFSKVKSILKWVNTHFKHNGELNIPKYLNSMELIGIAKKNGGYLNCRGLAVLTNELFLAASLYSKFIICEQKEIYIDDYHVLNSVFIKSINKWVMVDPSYNLYFKDINNNLLSIEEIRDSLIKEEKILQNEQANYYGERLSFELYKKSIVKKFYRFSSPIISKFGGDDQKNLISLVPSKKQYNFDNITDNSFEFWKNPEIN